MILKQICELKLCNSKLWNCEVITACDMQHDICIIKLPNSTSILQLLSINKCTEHVPFLLRSFTAKQALAKSESYLIAISKIFSSEILLALGDDSSNR